MIVTSPENFATTRRLRFTMQGIKSRHRRKAERMAPGDRMTWFLTQLAFQGNVHELDASDFAVIEKAIAEATRTTPARRAAAAKRTAPARA